VLAGPYPEDLVNEALADFLHPSQVDEHLTEALQAPQQSPSFRAADEADTDIE
jgi:hypothetical protein